jgi:transcriptional regulator with XRE-family HTH domain
VKSLLNPLAIFLINLTEPRPPKIALAPFAGIDPIAYVVYIVNMQHLRINSNSIGDHIRKLREQRANEDPSFSLRQVAARCDVTPAYLSRVERNEVAPPGEETLIKLASELGEDPDVLLAMAGKISTDLRAIILARPQLFADLIRSIKSTPDHAVLRIVRDVRDGAW